ncbi:MAG TPA: adenylate/guanylate cyclase domain-containing protein [Microvirga sp.]|nr:adenylate/guanylate cyclase domain-containing protein [Microvirga sp.]
MEESLNGPAPDASRLDGLARWLVDEAPHHSVEDLFAEFCREVVRRGLPVYRASLGLEVLHPEVSGWLHVWTDEATSVRASSRAGIGRSAPYINSPTRIVDETEAPFRRRLDAPCPDMPLLDELRDVGCTDYVMFPLPFLDRSRTAVASFATQQPGGFTAADVHELEGAARLFSPYAERHVLRRIAVDLLDTYVGPRTGQRIIEGRVERGQVELIEAALWFADLRGFTRLSEEASLEEVLATLNAAFEIMVEEIESSGGEVLKFIGDAVLAIFPTGGARDEATACRDALEAAAALCRRVDAANGERATAGLNPLTFAMALHVGTVAYGNMGAPHRLDFTVIGPAVNRASRLQDLAKRLQRRVVVSEAFASNVATALVDLGRHGLRDLEEPQRVFALP